jgi:dipeptidyl aminopeptidase/acylaminoacyl peptidase
MSSHNDVVYVKLDVRGARGQGSRSLYRHLGGVEVQDQITVLRSAAELPGHCPRIFFGKDT